MSNTVPEVVGDPQGSPVTSAKLIYPEPMTWHDLVADLGLVPATYVHLGEVIAKAGMLNKFGSGFVNMTKEVNMGRYPMLNAHYTTKATGGRQ